MERGVNGADVRVEKKKDTRRKKGKSKGMVQMEVLRKQAGSGE